MLSFLISLENDKIVNYQMWVDDDHFEEWVSFEDTISICVESKIGKITFTLTQSTGSIENVQLNGNDMNDIHVQFENIDEPIDG